MGYLGEQSPAFTNREIWSNLFMWGGLLHVLLQNGFVVRHIFISAGVTFHIPLGCSQRFTGSLSVIRETVQKEGESESDEGWNGRNGGAKIRG